MAKRRSAAASRASGSPKTWNEWLAANRLKKLVALPERVGDQVWDPTPEDKAAAWELFTEMRTRISTQPLHYRAGVEESALQSMVTLFQTTRDLLRKQGAGCRHFATITVRILNVNIRPFTALWHKRVESGLLKTEDGRRRFRQELKDLQKTLGGFQRFLGLLAEGDEFRKGSESGLEEVKAHRHDLGEGIPFETLLGLHETAGEEAVDEIVGIESTEIAERRKVALSESGNADQPLNNLVGLAISGGGIRSATFSVGVLQGLAERNLLREVDLMSTVSGGGYLGSMLSSYLDEDDEAIGLEPKQFPFARQGKCESKAIRFLRNHSRYLLSGGFMNRLQIVGQALYGVLMNLLILCPALFLAVLITRYTYDGDFRKIADAVEGDQSYPLGSPFDWWTALVRGIWGVGVLFLPTVQKMGRTSLAWRDRRRNYETICIGVFAIALAVAAIDLVPCAYYLFLELNMQIGLISADRFSFSWGALAAVAANLVAFFSARGLLVPQQRSEEEPSKAPGLLKKLAFHLLWLSGPVLLLAMYFLLSHQILVEKMTISISSWQMDRDVLLWLLVVVPFVYSMILNINFISPHRYYRNRLAETYLLRNKTDVDDHNAVHSVDPQLLSKLGQHAKAPYHIINGALNLPDSEVAELRGRDSDFFLFSKHFCGSPILGYFPTTEWEDLDGHLDLGTAMAISAAAAAPHMGTNTPRGASFLLTLLNVRLGYWLRRPDVKVMSRVWFKRLGGPGPTFLFREMFGTFNEETRYVNVSDGGHIENLAIYELLRRRCKFIIAIDGEADGKRELPSLMRLIQFAWIDYGTRIDIDVTRLRLTKKRFSQSHFAFGEITYPDDPGGESGHNKGFLLYVKLSATDNEPDYVRDYRSRHRTFPHESTADQLYSESQFEAYRALGEHVAGDLFDPELMENVNNDNLTVAKWFQALADNLLATSWESETRGKRHKP